jgi:ABC-type amino acid transport substrate-binding protein
MRSFPLMLAALLASGAASVHALDLPAVKKAGVLRVIVAADEAKETFDFAGGANPGFEREMLEGFARKEGVKLEVVRASGHSQRIPMLLKGDGDVIVAIFDTPERRTQVDFTGEVMPTHDVAVNLAPAAPVSTVDALKAVRVAVVRGTSTAKAAADFGVPAASLVQAEGIDALVGALQKSEAQAAILPVSELALASRRFPKLQAGVSVGTPGSVAWAVRKEDKALGAALDEYVRLFRSGPSWNRLVVKYFGDQVLAVLGRGR